MSRILVAAGLFLALCGGVVAGGDWPTYMHDSRRGGITAEALILPLEAVWVFEARRMPEPAWPAPAGQDFFHRHYNLRPTVSYDRAFEVVGAD
ncbi:MAG: PQQ-binding-like beta-propeller repeat protein, partial [Planctomycetota bacterium]